MVERLRVDDGFSGPAAVLPSRGRRRVLLCRGVLVLCLLLGFGGIAGAREVTVGVVGSFSGPQSVLGIAAAQGAVLALEERNAAGGVGGRRIRILLGDDEGDPRRAASVDQDLIRRGVRLFLGHSLSSTTEAALPLMERHRCLLVSPLASSPRLSGRDDLLVRLPSAAPFSARDLGRHGARLGLRRVACAWDRGNEIYALPWVESFAEAFRREGGEMTARRSYLRRAGFSFDELAAELLRHRPDGVLAVAGALDVALLAQRLRLRGFQGPILCAPWGVGRELVAYGGGAVEGLRTIHFVHPLGEVGEFSDRFRSRFREDPSWSAVLGYETAQVLLEALEATGSEDPETLKGRMVGRSYPGLEVSFFVDRFGDVRREDRIYEYREGTFREVEP